MKFKREANSPICQDCQHFRQHYTRQGRKFISIYCGHCVHLQNRRGVKKPDAPVCQHFAQKAR